LAGFDDLGEDALFAVVHEGAKAGGDVVHFCAGIAGFSDEDDGGANADAAAGERDEVDVFGFDVGTNEAFANGWEPEDGGVFGDLFAFNEGELAFGRFAVARLASEVAFVLHDPLPCDEVEFRNGNHWFTGDRRMNVEREDAGDRRFGRTHWRKFAGRPTRRKEKDEGF
jgi:hypothetical protein